MTDAYEPFGCPSPYAEPLWYSRNVSPHYTDSHRALRAVVRRYVDEELIPFAYDWEEAGKVPDEVYQRHADLGYLGLVTGLPDVPLPGGIPNAEWDSWHSLIVTDELNRVGYSGVLWGLGGGNGIGAPPIANFGTPAQKTRYLPGVANGSIRFCLGITEPDAGSDVANIKTTAIRQGDQYLVNGSKKWITNGLWADYMTAAVRTGGPGAGGISLLIIPLKNTPGVTLRAMRNSGVSASGSTFITLEDVRVPAASLIRGENAGFAAIMSNFNGERKALATAALRLARVCAQDAWAHASTRHTFGQPLLRNAVIRQKFLAMGRAIEPAHAFLEQLTHLIETNRRADHADTDAAAVRIGGMTAMLKVVSTRCLELCVREAQQILGGLGYARGGKGGRIEAISRDVRVMAVGGGSEEIMSELAIREEAKDLNRYVQQSQAEKAGTSKL